LATRSPQTIYSSARELHMLVRWLAIGLLLGCWMGLGCAPSEQKDKVVMVADDDPQMKQAIASARARLPEFWTIFEQPSSGETNFALKVEITDASGTEFFWASNLERQDGKIFGVIDNDPNTVKSVKLGQRIEIPEDKIADWTYIRDEKIYGNLTMRPLLKTLPKEQADELRARLAEP
jgi:uncharacterized protein YegJ (DUF2314 family)